MLDTAGTKSGPTLEIGQVIGPSEWVTIDQEMIDGFAKFTLDPDPFHIDPDFAQANSPFGTTIAFGFQTMSLLTHLMQSAQGAAAREIGADPATHGHYMNYGFDKLRLISPVKVGARIRGVFTVADFHWDEKGRGLMTFDAVVEIEGEGRPALAARWVSIWLPG